MYKQFCKIAWMNLYGWGAQIMGYALNIQKTTKDEHGNIVAGTNPAHGFYLD